MSCIAKKSGLVLGAVAFIASMARDAAAAVFYSGESVSGVSMTGVSSLNAHLNSTSSLRWTATFDYGLTSSYGSTAAGSTGANNVPPFYNGNVASVPISGLACGTTYHWAVVVAGAHDVDQTFTTTACPAPAISVSPSIGGFSAVTVGATLQKTFIVSNPGTADLVVSGITLAGHQSTEFALALGTCASLTPTLTAGNSCTLLITFSPDTPGHMSTTFGVASNAGTVDITLSGSGVGAGNVPTLTEWGTILLGLAFVTVLLVRSREGATAPG
ncbi:MAG TPA: choice-of-anchor D domain-containing protein [Polyangiaceae bacterium]|nr:choice-of-anchor D domain-containing protein [Polyangiaceae bacterium]